MNFAQADRVYQLALDVTTAREKITESLDAVDMHGYTCEDCQPGKPCGDAQHLDSVLVGCIEQHAQTLEEWREAKYGQEQP
jgi:hypothetical protein